MTTSKYNLVTFLPIFLFEMFTRVAYLYFLIQAGLSWWSVVSPYSGIGATMALTFVLVVAGVKAIWEDVKRHREDEILNKSITHRVVFDGEGEASTLRVEDVSWTVGVDIDLDIDLVRRVCCLGEDDHDDHDDERRRRRPFHDDSHLRSSTPTPTPRISKWGMPSW